MEFITEVGFDVATGRVLAFQQWLADNEAALAAACPEGVEYLGTFAAIYSSEKHTGSFREMYRLDSYAAQDSMAAAMTAGGEFARLQQEFNEFLDFERGADRSNGLFKRVTDAVLWEPTD